MRAKSEKRLQAEKLRKEQGLSYNEIAEITGISKSTLSYWLRNIPLNNEQEARLEQRLHENRSTFAARAWPINQERYRQAREHAFLAGADVINHLPESPSINELALAMLYLGEGDKSGNRVQIASVNPQILGYFRWALEALYGIHRESLACRLNLVEAAKPIEGELIAWWANTLRCSPEQFQKNQYDTRSRYVHLTSDYRGVCTITCNDTYLFCRISGIITTYLKTREKEATVEQEIP